MILNYTYDNPRSYFGYDEFDYEIGYQEIKEYFNSLDNKELIDCLEEIFLDLDEKDQKQYIDYSQEEPIKKYDTLVPNYELLIEEDKDWCLDIFTDNEHKTYILFSELLEDYYSQDAYEAYEEYEYYRNHPEG